MLGHGHATTGDRERRHRRHVDAVQLIAAGSHDVDDVGSNSERGRGVDHCVDETRHLLRRFALGGEGGEEAGDENRVHASLENFAERETRLVAFEVGAAHQWVQYVEGKRVHRENPTKPSADIATR